MERHLQAGRRFRGSFCWKFVPFCKMHGQPYRQYAAHQLTGHISGHHVSRGYAGDKRQLPAEDKRACCGECSVCGFPARVHPAVQRQHGEAGRNADKQAGDRVPVHPQAACQLVHDPAAVGRSSRRRRSIRKPRPCISRRWSALQRRACPGPSTFGHEYARHHNAEEHDARSADEQSKPREDPDAGARGKPQRQAEDRAEKQDRP